MKSHPKDRNLEPILHVSTSLGFLYWSQNFLSAIFGILGKFRIDIGENYFQKNIFFETKKFSRKKIWKIFRFFWKSFYFLRTFSNFAKILPQKSKNFEHFQKNWKFWETFKIFHWKSEQTIFFENVREKVLVSKKYFLEVCFQNIFHLYRS